MIKLKFKNHPENCLLYSCFDSFQICWQNIIVNFQGKQTLSSTWQVLILWYSTKPYHLNDHQTTILVINRKYNPSDRFSLCWKYTPWPSFCDSFFVWKMQSLWQVWRDREPRVISEQRTSERISLKRVLNRWRTDLIQNNANLNI